MCNMIKALVSEYGSTAGVRNGPVAKIQVMSICQSASPRPLHGLGPSPATELEMSNHYTLCTYTIHTHVWKYMLIMHIIIPYGKSMLPVRICYIFTIAQTNIKSTHKIICILNHTGIPCFKSRSNSKNIHLASKSS